MDPATETSLLASLNSPTTTTHDLFSTYLRPFQTLHQQYPQNTPKTLTLIRTLAKQFLPFLNQSLSQIPKLLSKVPKLPPQSAALLFPIYRLCLDCLEAVSSQLSGSPYSINIQRVRLMHCFEAWGEYGEAEREGMLVMRELVKKKKGSLGNLYVPRLEKEEDKDGEFGFLVVEVVVTLVKCVSIRQSKEDGDYRRVIVLVSEVAPWFSVVDANAYEKLHRVLVLCMTKCGLFLVGDLMHFERKLVCEFCLATFAELAKSDMKDQRHKFAHRICCSLFSQQGNESSIFDILACVLDSMSSECNVETETSLTELLKVVHYCANKSRTSSSTFRCMVAAHLQKIADKFRLAGLSPTDLIMSLYVTGLDISYSYGRLRSHGSSIPKTAKGSSIFDFFIDNENRIENLAGVFGSLKHHYNFPEWSNFPFRDECENSVHQMHSPTGYNTKASICSQMGKSDMLCYRNALQFLCQPLAELVNSERKEILTDIDEVSFGKKLYIIQDACHQFLDVLLSCQSACEKETDGSDDNKRLLSVAMAVFTLSFRTKLRIKDITTFLKHAITSDWIQSHGLKYLFAALHNVGIVFYRVNQLEEASKALKLCCRASWTCVISHCKMFADKINGFCGDLSEDDILSILTEACSKTAFVLDVLYQCGSHKVNRIIIDSLESWSVAEHWFERLTSPTTLVKQWVKIQCKLYKDTNVTGNTRTLYSLLLFSAKVSKRALGLLIEQEFLLYKEMSKLNRVLCQKMLMDIMEILLEEVYVTRSIQRSQILLCKGRELRAGGVERLDECITCLSESISIMIDTSVGSCCGNIQSYQLATAYCLRALCCQEALCFQKAESNSKIFEDIDSAVKIWLNTYNGCISEQTDMVFENNLSVLYYVVDLLSLKGYMKFHVDVYEIVIRLFKLKNIPLKRCLSVLWECRRLGHALCASPVSEIFIRTLSQHCDEPNSMEFWLSCLKESKSLQVGFKQIFSFSFANFSSGSHCHELTSGSDITIDAVKQAASDLLSGVPVPSCSSFQAAYLYYDLCVRLMSTGRFIEALPYAKEALQIRSKLFRENFVYSIEQQPEVYNENGEVIRKQSYSLKAFRMFTSAATAAWACEHDSCDFEHHLITPWNVLQCYLESTLQVGSIHEVVGNGSDAETLLLWGKSISCSQDLPLFIIAFSSILGKFYCKQRLWDLAEKELQTAEQMLKEMHGPFYCYKCKLVLEISIDQQFGDLFRGRNIEQSSMNGLLYAEKRYKSGIKKLKISEWKNSVSDPEEAKVSSNMFSDVLAKDAKHGTNSPSHRETQHFDIIEVSSECNGTGANYETKISKRTRKSSKASSQNQGSMQQNNLMMTRSRSRTSNKVIGCDQDAAQNDCSVSSKVKNEFACTDSLLQPLESKILVDNSTSTVICDYNKTKCWHCLPHEVRESGYLINHIHLKWEFVRRRLLLGLLTNIGKCLVLQSEKHKADDVYLESISVLVRRNLFSPTCNPVPFKSMLALIGSTTPGDLLAVERATILYNLCWFILKNYQCKGTSVSSDLSRVEISTIMSWLKLAFILCLEVPILLQKVSRLLAVLYICSENKLFYVPPSPSETLSASQWASYFHQASLGAHFNHLCLSHMPAKQKTQKLMEVEGLVSSTSVGPEARSSFSRTTPDILLKELMTNFFQNLPPATVICLSLLGSAYSSLLRELFFSTSSVHAWMLFSRLNLSSQPIILLLPVDSIPEDASDDDEGDETCSPGIPLESKNFIRRWHCPWGSTVVDDVAPMFKTILEHNYLSSSTYPLEDTKENRSRWWMQRRKLDQCLGNFLKDVEDTWFGQWKYLLWGESSDCPHLNLIVNKLAKDLKVKFKVEVHVSLLRVILAGGKYACQSKECVSQLILNKGCYVGGMECNVDKVSGASELILETIHEIEEYACAYREPIILVLDYEVQMLPWESLPLLRNQEVYRMPSVGSIFTSIDRYNQEKLGNGSNVFPSIDPLDAYYLLNPSGDLCSTEIEFDKWFKDQHLEGKTGTTPTIEELTFALKSHELFIYFGHGSGEQYIPGHEIKKLETCAATFLMGCSSGSLSLCGSYTPQGAPLCYLLAGSPVIVANLWEVTDKDIDRFGKAMLDAWIRERSTEADCVQCNSLLDELKSMNINAAKGKGKRKATRKKLAEDCDVNSCNTCRHRPKAGSFMGQAREACTLPFLIGASPVCYGVPTGIIKKLKL